MREFFKDTLETLHIITGCRQMEFLSEDEVKILVDKLCVVSEKNYGYIPLEAQKHEITRQILEEPDFSGLNPKVLHKWLSRIADRYWQERNRKLQDKEDLNQVPGPISKDTEKLIENFKAGLLPATVARSIPEVSAGEIKAIQAEDRKRAERPTAVSTGYNRLTTEQVLAKENHQLYLTAKWTHDQDPRNEGQIFPEEAVWIELQKP